MPMLKKMKMPKPKSFDMAEMEEGYDEGMAEGEEEMGEGAEEQMAEDESEEKHTGPKLDSLSDEDLLAEVKKRGLMSQMDEEMGEESAEDAYI